MKVERIEDLRNVNAVSFHGETAWLHFPRMVGVHKIDLREISLESLMMALRAFTSQHFILTGNADKGRYYRHDHMIELEKGVRTPYSIRRLFGAGP